MFELALKIVPWLGVAWLLGFAVAWLLRGVTVAELIKRCEQLETDLGTREIDLGVARRDLGASQTHLAALEGDLAHAERHAATLASSLERQKTDFAADQLRLTEQAASRLAMAQGEFDRRSAMLEHELSAAAAVDAELAHARGRLAELDHLQGALASREAEAGTLGAELQALRTALNEAHQNAAAAAQRRDDEMARLRGQLEPLVSLRDMLAGREAEFSARDAELASREVRWAERALDFERRLAALATERDAARALSSRVNELEAHLERCGVARESLVNELAALPTAPTEPANRPLNRYAERSPGAADDLKRIYGVGPVLEKMLHRFGIYEFRQVALWTDTDIDFFDAQLEKFHGRIRRENWVRSATEAHYKKHGEWLGSGALPAITLREPQSD